MSARKRWYGWIVKKETEGFNPTWRVEYYEGVNKKTMKMSGPTEAIEFFDGLAGKEVKLIATPLGAYRVYTEEEDNKA